MATQRHWSSPPTFSQVLLGVLGSNDGWPATQPAKMM